MHYSRTAENSRIQDFTGSHRGFSTIDQASANNRFMTLIILAALQISSRCGIEEAYRNLQILVSQESQITLKTSVKKAIWQKAKAKRQFNSRRHLQECVRPPDSLVSGAPSECWFPDSPSM